jgi:negative regulator of flagellin synthesis FlgM
MVDPIGARTISGRDVAVSRITPVSSAKTSTGTTQTADTAALTGVSQALSTAPPVDTDRVARVKKAIADGKFPILPTTIADRLIAYKLEWTQNDPA